MAAALAVGPASAQMTACHGRDAPIGVWSIDQVDKGGGRYRYDIASYNRTVYPYSFDLTFSGFKRVVLGSPVMANVQIAGSGRVAELMFGFRSNSNINRATVQRVHDQRPSRGGATVRIANCRRQGW